MPAPEKSLCHVPCIISPHSGQSWDAYRSPETSLAYEMQKLPALSALLKTSLVAAAFCLSFLRSCAFGAKVVLFGDSHNGHYKTRLSGHAAY